MSRVINIPQGISILDVNGDLIDTVSDSDGSPHLGVAIIQKVTDSSGNSTTANLAAGATFTGTGQETYGANAIQMFHYADQDCTIYIDQGTAVDNFELTDELVCLANNPCSRIFASVAPFYRMRVKNNGASATTDHKTLTAVTPIINPMPRSLSDDDRLKVESTLTGKENTERHVWVTPSRDISVAETTKLIGTSFDGTTKDPNFWTEAVTGTGTVTQAGEIQLNTGTTANSTAAYQTVRRARFVAGSALRLNGVFKLVTAGTMNNLRRWGAYDTTDGFFFQINGTTFSIGTRKASSDTLVSSGSFNGNYGPSITISESKYYKYEIEWTPRAVFFYVDGKLLHKIGTGHLSNFLTLPAKFENVNSGGLTTDVSFDCLSLIISRLGPLHTNPTYKYIAGATTTILKYGAGELHTIVNNDNSGSMIIYDNTAGSGTIIASVDLAKVLGTLTFDAPFNTGLTIVTTGAGAKITVMYE